MAGVMNDYIKFGDGADQFASRLCSGLDLNSEEFSILPPHFASLSSFSNILVEAEWKKIFVSWDYLPLEFKGTLPFFLASLVMIF